MLTDTQTKEYFKTQSGLANPMSPLAYEKSLTNYDPNKVQTSQNNVPSVISSKDDAQKVAEKHTKFDPILEPQEKEEEVVKEEVKPETVKQTITPAEEKETGTGNVAYDTYKKSLADTDTKFDAWEEEQRAKQDKRYRTGLADLDANLASEIQSMNETFDLRLKEQRRINELNISRVRAYGLGHGGGYKPIMFGDAVTNREQEASNKIDELETRRMTVLQKIKNAFEQGKSGLLDDLDDEYENIKQEVYDKIKDAKEESLATYKLGVQLRKEEEAKDLLAREEVIKNINALVSLNIDEYENMTPEEMDATVAEMVAEFNIEPFEAYNAIMDGKALGREQAQAKLKEKETEADIAKTEADIKLQEEKVRTEKSKQYATYKKADEEGGEAGDDFTNVQNQKLEQAGLGDAERQQKLDFFYDELYDEGDFVANAEIGSTVVIGGRRYKKIADDDFELIK